MQLVAYWAPLNLYCCLLHFAMPCLIKPDMHHTWLCIMTCLCLVVYYVVCFFPVLLLRVSSENVVFVRIRSTMFVCLLHGFVLLPCGISCKMTIPSKSLLSLLASCSLYCFVAIPTTCYIMPPILPCQASNPPCPSKPLFGYVTALLSPSYSIVSCRWSWSSFHVGTWLLVGISQYLLLN